MTQQLEFSVSRVKSVEFCKKSHIWFVDIGPFVLECPLIAANVDTFYVSCEAYQQVQPGDLDLFDYVKPMERDEKTRPV